MKRPGKRRITLAVCPLEDRQLLSGGPTGTWIGQDGHDQVGLSRVLGGNDVQDIHIAIAGLPADRTITLTDVQGLGGGRWQSTGLDGWMAAVVRSSGSSTADLFIEPYQVETGRPFDIHLTYENGSSAEFWVVGGPADPNLRMPNAAVHARWVGQDGQDGVGPGPSVGPDGIQDVRIALSHLSAGTGIESVTLDGPTGSAWQSGLNHQALANAELSRHPDDPSQADLFINPNGDLSGKPLRLSLVCDNGKTDSTILIGGASDPNLHAVLPAPVSVNWGQMSAQWLGQDGQDLTGRGDVHVALGGLPPSRTVVAATLSDGVAGSWVYRGVGQSAYYAEPYAAPLAFQRSATQPTEADLDFPPIRDESGATMTLRLLFDDGTSTITSFAGSYSDPGQRAPGPAPTAISAHPGDDLNDLVNRFGHVHLAAGTYRLGKPLILNNPVTIDANPGATLVFSQALADATWTAAIKIHNSHTTLDGFAVRFVSPIRWNWGVDYGPAVIGTTDNLDQGHSAIKADVAITHMDIATPPPASAWEEAPRLLRLVSASSGTVAHNVLKGGTTEFVGGPWKIVENDYQGTLPGTFAYDAFAGHYTHDLVLVGNQAHLVGPSGKTWRFLVLTQSGSNDVIESNTVTGIGPRDDDTVAQLNAPEIILTESYRLHFEGKPAALSADGRIVQVEQPQADPPRTGDVVAVLSGPRAGQWRRITQAINPTTYLLDEPLPLGDYAISIATGFVGETFRGNTIDCRGSSVAVDLNLRGNHYGTSVIGNHLLGGGEALRFTAAATEQPVFWGWSHAPFLDGVIEGNTLEDSLRGGTLSVEHGAAIKSNQGRVYMTVTLRDNTALWSEALLARHPQSGDMVAFTVGESGSIDPGELVVQEQGNRVRGPVGYRPGASLQVGAAIVNGQAEFDQRIVLPTAPPTAPANLRLASDKGMTVAVGVTADGRLQFDQALGAAGYEYRLGNSTVYTPIGAQTTFQPAGLVAGSNSIFVRAFDDQGQFGPDAAITIFFIPPVPLSGVWLGQDGHDLVGLGRRKGGDRVQDIHIALSGLPADRTITFVDVRGVGGGDWQYSGPPGPWKAALVRTPGASTAALFVQPYRRETGRLFWVTLHYDDGSTAVFSVTGGTASATLKMPAKRTASRLGARKGTSGATAELPGGAPHTTPSVIGSKWSKRLIAWQRR